MKVLTNDKIYFPRTFDVKGYPRNISRKSIYLAALIQIVVVIAAIVFGILYWDNVTVRCICFIVPFVSFGCLRQFYLQENYFRKQFEDLENHDYKYDASMFWRVYDIADVKGYKIFRLPNKKNVVFVQFVKGVIIGQGQDSRRKHHDALALAYRKMALKKINFMHIDYMDSVGRDKRFEAMVNTMKEKVENPELEDVLSYTYRYLKKQMNQSLATYDLYAFTYTGEDINFLEDLNEILDTFMKANYIAYEVLDAKAVREVVMSIYNLEDFSVDRAKSNIYKKGIYSENHLRLIEVITADGEIEKINETRAEILERNRVQKARKSVKLKKGFKKSKSKEDVMNLFDD